ncbi:MAG: spore maturation protein [Clostridiales bacterium]|nr:spore maturation protein [Clostridiales bacterium]
MNFSISDFIIPTIIAVILVTGLVKKVDVFNEFLEGAAENLKTAVSILPALIALMTCVGMFKSSGGLGIITSLISPITDFLGFPSECVPLAILRPVSGSGSIAMYESILSDNHPDSFAVRVASVLLGSTETTFYTMAVYYGAAKIKNTRQTLVAAISADFTGFVFSVFAVRLFFYIL